MEENKQPGADEPDDYADRERGFAAGHEYPEGMMPHPGMIPPWILAALMGSPGAMPPTNPYVAPWAAPPGLWGGSPYAGAPPPLMAPPCMPMTASMQALDALLYWMASRADIWQHLLAAYADAAASTARTSRTLWDRGPFYSGMHAPREPEFLQELVTKLRGLPSDQAWRVFSDVVSLHAMDAARWETRPQGAPARTGPCGEVDLEELQKSLDGFPEQWREQVTHAVRVGQESRRRWRAPSRANGYDI